MHWAILSGYVEYTPWCKSPHGALFAIMGLRRVFAHNLKALRRDRGLSQEALADAAGLDRTYVSSLERELYGASLDTVERLAAALDIAAADLLRED